MNTDPEGVVCGEEAARLLPWYLTGRLAPGDVTRVERHLERCAICRADLAHDQALRGALRNDGPLDYSPRAGLDKTLARIDEMSREVSARDDGDSAVPAPVPRRRPAAMTWLTAAVVVQTVGLGILGAALIERRGGTVTAARYETLSAAPVVPSRQHIRAVFAPATTLQELRGLLASRALVIVGGPSDAGAFTLASTDLHRDVGGLAETLAGLRGDHRVLFAEPATNEAVAPR